MSELERNLKARIDAFVEELTELVRLAAIDAVRKALGDDGVELSAPQRGRRGKAPNVAQAGSPRRAKGQKRPQEELERTRERLLAFVKQNPGLGVEDIAKQLGTSTKELNLPLRKLVGAGLVTTEGVKRATKYFPGSGQASGSSKGRGRRGRD